MQFRETSISIIAALAVSGGASFAQSGGEQSFCNSGYTPADANADGMIDEAELSSASDSEFAALDANGDGMVSQEEYLDCRTGWLPEESVTETLSEEDVTVLDANSDGKIDQAEYMGAADHEYTARWSPTGSETEVRDSERADGEAVGEEDSSSTETADSGQSLSAEDEKVSGVILRRIIFIPADESREPGDMSRGEIASRTAQKFLLLDTDGNKVIAPEDSADARAANAIMNQTLNQQFTRADADKSGDISPEEYAADTQKRWESARDRAATEGGDTGAGAPVVYFLYPHPM